ncbi:MAG: putative iron-sulfur protein [Acidimicrobiaceae bacterium]|nr:MAG: putative iron-sulfur protein [Acidimicrobiaceae bacterium]
MYQKCPHLGCRVPSCTSSQWFECPCHGSQYNRVGEKKAGPAPRGMDHFALTISSSGDVVIDTGTVYPGQPIGTNTTGQEAEGPHCV